MELKYIIIRRAKDEIRQNYIYFGETDATDTIETDEGTLHWIPEEELLCREFSATFDAMLKHHASGAHAGSGVVVGVAGDGGGKLDMTWTVVEDFE